MIIHIKAMLAARAHVGTTDEQNHVAAEKAAIQGHVDTLKLLMPETVDGKNTCASFCLEHIQKIPEMFSNNFGNFLYYSKNCNFEHFRNYF